MTQKDFNDKLKKLNLNLDDFAKLVNLPAGTVYGWNRQGKNPPAWVLSWFDNYEKKQEYEYIIKNQVINMIENITKGNKQD